MKKPSRALSPIMKFPKQFSKFFYRKNKAQVLRMNHQFMAVISFITTIRQIVVSYFVGYWFGIGTLDNTKKLPHHYLILAYSTQVS
jgi:hypothetical protein